MMTLGLDETETQITERQTYVTLGRVYATRANKDNDDRICSAKSPQIR